jgi:hypothetical protein
LDAAVSATSGNIGDIVVGDIDMHQATGDYVSLNLYVYATGDVSSLTVGNFSMVAEHDSGWTEAYAYIDVNADTLGAVTFGDVSISAADSADAVFTVSLSNVDIVGDVTIGDVSLVNASSADAEVYFYLTQATSDVTVNVGTVSFDGTVNGSANFGLYAGSADVVIDGITIIAGDDGADVGNGYALTVTGDAIMIDNITVNVSATGTGQYDLTNILSNVTAAGTLTLGTVDFSGYELTGNTSTGEITIIGTSRADTIEGNDESNTLTGGSGTDVFVFQAMDQNLTATTDDMVMDSIVDFVAGDSSSEKIDLSALGLSGYAEGSASDAAEAFDTALAKFALGYDVAAIQIGSDTYVMVDEDGGGAVDSIIKLVGVTTATLNLADFDL